MQTISANIGRFRNLSVRLQTSGEETCNLAGQLCAGQGIFILIMLNCHQTANRAWEGRQPAFHAHLGHSGHSGTGWVPGLQVFGGDLPDTELTRPSIPPFQPSKPGLRFNIVLRTDIWRTFLAGSGGNRLVPPAQFRRTLANRHAAGTAWWRLGLVWIGSPAIGRTCKPEQFSMPEQRTWTMQAGHSTASGIPHWCHLGTQF